MAVDFELRVEELLTHLDKEYGIVDRQAVEIILASCLPMQPDHALTHPLPEWLILETDYHSLQTYDSWFTFGGQVRVGTLSYVRIHRPRQGSEIVKGWFAAPESPLIVIEPQYTKPTRVHGRLREYTPLHQLLRIRSATPLNGAAITKDESRYAKTRYLFGRVVDCTFRQPENRSIATPKDYLYWCELAYKMAGNIHWETLIKKVYLAVIRRAWLYNREVVKEDWKVAGRLLADQIPYWTKQLVESTYQTESGRLTKLSALKATGFERHEKLRECLSRQIVEGCLVYGVNGQYWHLRGGERLYTLVQGRCFDV